MSAEGKGRRRQEEIAEKERLLVKQSLGDDDTRGAQLYLPWLDLARLGSTPTLMKTRYPGP
jgi:hypothetical protein